MTYKIIGVKPKAWVNSNDEFCSSTEPNAVIKVQYEVLIVEISKKYKAFAEPDLTGAALYSTLKAQANITTLEGQTF